MTWTDASTHPTEPGWYACKLHMSDRPVVLWWSNRGEWRSGCVRMNVTQWMGPIA